MKYPEFKTICITILKEQNDWLATQPNNKSEVIRFAIKELMQKEQHRPILVENGNVLTAINTSS